MNRTILSQLLNDEILLPIWLHHHKKLFTHGVILDCGSTDNSINIIKEICPTWEVKDVSHLDTSSPNLDVNLIEQEEMKLEGWKCALNVTEFLIIDNLEKYLLNFEKNNPSAIGFRATGVIIVDRPTHTDLEQFNDINLITKKDFGYVEKGKAWSSDPAPAGTYPTTLCLARNRLIHKNSVGLYLPGRHETRLPVNIDPEIYVSWIGRGSPELYYKRFAGWKDHPKPVHHQNYRKMVTKDFLDKFWLNELTKSVNIFENIPKYKEYLDILYNLSN